MKRTPLQRTRQIKRGKQLVKSRIKRKRRKPSEFARIYGSKARVEWVKRLPCVVCGERPCDNAHIVTGGMGRKADADKIVPLCGEQVEGWIFDKVCCHRMLHVLGVETFQKRTGIDLEQEAAKCEAAWQASQSLQERLA